MRGLGASTLCCVSASVASAIDVLQQEPPAGVVPSRAIGRASPSASLLRAHAVRSLERFEFGIIGSHGENQPIDDRFVTK